MKAALAVGTTLLALAADSALAASARVDFSGRIVSISGIASDALELQIAESVSIGTPFSGFFTFDDASAPHTIVGDPDDPVALYTIPSPAWTLHASLGDYSIQLAEGANGYGIRVSDTSYMSRVEVSGHGVSASGAGAETFDDIWLTFNLASLDPDRIESTLLDRIPWELEGFEGGRVVYWQFSRGGRERVEIYGSVDSVRSVPGPARSTLAALVLLAVTGLGFRRAWS